MARRSSLSSVVGLVSESAMPEGRRLRILLIDDEPDILLLLQAMLTAPSWEIIGKAASGEDALRLATDMTPDVAVVDYMMPGMHGLDVAAGLKTACPTCEVVVFSAFDVEREATASPEVDRFLRKRDASKLEEILREIADGKGLSA